MENEFRGSLTTLWSTITRMEVELNEFLERYLFYIEIKGASQVRPEEERQLLSSLKSLEDIADVAQVSIQFFLPEVCSWAVSAEQAKKKESAKRRLSEERSEDFKFLRDIFLSRLDKAEDRLRVAENDILELRMKNERLERRMLRRENSLSREYLTGKA